MAVQDGGHTVSRKRFYKSEHACLHLFQGRRTLCGVRPGLLGYIVTAYFLVLPAADDMLLLAVIFLTLVLSAYTGRYVCRTLTCSVCPERGVVTVSTLTLSGLLIGLVFSVSVSSYSAQEQAEVGEALAVSSAWQYAALLPAGIQQKVHVQLQQYLNDRIRFFEEDTATAARGRTHASEQHQKTIWSLIVPCINRTQTPVMASVLTAYNQLLVSKQQTQAVWKRQIPDAVWLVLILLAASACFLIGNHIPDSHGHHFYLLLLPALTSLVLFMIAEIDIPGQGVIRVTPDELERLEASLIIETSGDIHILPSAVLHIH